MKELLGKKCIIFLLMKILRCFPIIVDMIKAHPE